jgi:hypothetical protein
MGRSGMSTALAPEPEGDVQVGYLRSAAGRADLEVRLIETDLHEVVAPLTPEPLFFEVVLPTLDSELATLHQGRGDFFSGTIDQSGENRPGNTQAPGRFLVF